VSSAPKLEALDLIPAEAHTGVAVADSGRAHDDHRLARQEAAPDVAAQEDTAEPAAEEDAEPAPAFAGVRDEDRGAGEGHEQEPADDERGLPAMREDLDLAAAFSRYVLLTRGERASVEEGCGTEGR
jgi:hypothetical protein